MATWVKPNGNTIEINDTSASVSKAKQLGWKPAEKPKRKRRTKAELEAAKQEAE